MGQYLWNEIYAIFELAKFALVLGFPIWLVWQIVGISRRTDTDPLGNQIVWKKGVDPKERQAALDSGNFTEYFSKK